MAKEHKLVDVTMYRDLDIDTFRVKALTGKDQTDAAVRALPASGEEMSQHLFNLQLRNEQLAQAITEVDGETVRGGSCRESVDWSMRTREFVFRAYSYVNGISDDEHDDFMARLAGKADAVVKTSPAPSTPA